MTDRANMNLWVTPALKGLRAYVVGSPNGEA